MKVSKLEKRLKFVMQDGSAWCFEVSEAFDLRTIEQQLNESLEEFVRFEIENEEFVVRANDIQFIDLGYELIGSY